MNTSLSSPLTRSLFVFGLVLGGIVACGTGPTESVESSLAKQTSEAQPAPPTPPAPTCSANAGEEACVMCCAGDGPAKQIFQTTMSCLTACGKNDEACQDQCWTAYDTACASAGDACSAAESCAEKTCFPKPPPGDDDDDDGKNGKK